MVRYASHGTGITGGSGATSVTLGPETSNTPVAGANDTVAGTTNRYYSFFTFPTASALYLVTGFECLNGTVVSGNIQFYLDQVEANPPVIAFTNLLAYSIVANQTGTSAVQRISRVSSHAIPGGTIVGSSVVCSSATARIGTTTVGSANNLRAIAIATPNNSSNTVWTAGTEEAYVKVYYRAIL